MHRLFYIVSSLRISCVLLQTLGAAAAAPLLPAGQHRDGTISRTQMKHDATVCILCGRIGAGGIQRLISTTG